MKKILSLFTIMACICSFFSISANAGDLDVPIVEWDVKPVSELTNAELEAACSIFFTGSMDMNWCDLEDVIPVYDLNEIQAGYQVTFHTGSGMDGYVIFDFRNESNPIVEYACDTHVVTPYETVCERMVSQDVSLQTRSGEPLFVYVNGLLNGVIGTDGMLHTSYDEVYDTADFSQASSRSIIYANWDSLLSVSVEEGSDVWNDTVWIDAYSPEYSCLSQWDIMDMTATSDYPMGYYACGVVALTEVAGQYDILLNDSIKDTYLKLWDTTNTSETKQDLYGDKEDLYDDYIQGSTTDTRLMYGFEDYCDFIGVSGSASRKVSPTFNYFKDAVDNGMSAVLASRIFVEDEDAAYEKSGHTINILGYYIHANSDGTTTNYLVVADGWNTVPKQFAYEDIDFASPVPYGVVYNVG